MKPVQVMASCWFAEMFSAGRLKSPMFAIVISHLKVGAQKKIVKGPAGWRRRLRMEVGQGAPRVAGQRQGLQCVTAKPAPQCIVHNHASAVTL